MNGTLDAFLQLDKQITLWINNLNPQWMDPFWHTLSLVKIWFPLYAAVMVFALWKLGWKKGLVVVLSLILCVILTDQLSGLVKAWAERPRPCRDSWMLLNGLRLPDGPAGGLWGFFSAHASNCFGFATASYLGLRLNDRPHRYKAYEWCIGIWAALLSFSRIVLGAHFLGDVLAGAIFGAAVGSGMAYLAYAVILKARL